MPYVQQPEDIERFLGNNPDYKKTKYEYDLMVEYLGNNPDYEKPESKIVVNGDIWVLFLVIVAFLLIIFGVLLCGLNIKKREG